MEKIHKRQETDRRIEEWGEFGWVRSQVEGIKEMGSAGAKTELGVKWATDQQEQRRGFVWEEAGVIQMERRLELISSSLTYFGKAIVLKDGGAGHFNVLL